MAANGMADMSVVAGRHTKYLQNRVFYTGRSGHDRGQTPVMAGKDVAGGDFGGG
jgi:hypothetical protein